MATEVVFARGVLVSGPVELQTPEADGVELIITPDDEIFRATFGFESLAEMLRDFSLRRRVPVELRDLGRNLLFTHGA